MKKLVIPLLILMGVNAYGSANNTFDQIKSAFEQGKNSALQTYNDPKSKLNEFLNSRLMTYFKIGTASTSIIFGIFDMIEFVNYKVSTNGDEPYKILIRAYVLIYLGGTQFYNSVEKIVREN